MAFMGMRGDGDWTANQRPENWREVILYEFPNGDAPITAILSMMPTEGTDDSVFHWWTKRLPGQAGAVSGVYIDAGLSTAYVYASHQSTFGAAGATIYVKVAEALAKEFRAGHQVLLRDSDRWDVDVVGKVTAVVYNGSNSYIAVKLLEDDDNSADSSNYNLSTVDRIIIIGNINPQGGPIPRAIAYDPVEFINYTQIFRSPLEITRTAKKTHLRTGDAYQEAKKEALRLHSIEQEKALIWGVLSSTIGANGKPERTFDGILSFLRKYATNPSQSLDNFALNSDYSGQSWLDAGEDWLDEKLEYLGTYAPSEVIALCGAGALTGLHKLAKHLGNIQLTPGPGKTYGITFTTWLNPHITVHLKKHPLLSREPSTAHTMVLFSPKNIKMRILDDTKFLPEREARGVDGSVEEYLSELGPEFHFPDQFMVLDGVGQDNNL